MPSVFNPGPSGFLPVNLLGGRVYAGSTRHIPIASGYAQNIGFGDLVALDANGQAVRVDTSAGAKADFNTAKVIGVFLGCGYSQTSGLKYTLNAQNWVSGTTASDVYAVVVDDPDAIFQVTLTNASGVQYTSSAATQSNVGNNIGYYQPATFVNASGNSTVSANLASATTTSTLPFRIIDVVQESALPSDGSFTQVLVTYNFGLHFYRQATGI
jgi:hypothetical protein